MEQSHPRLAPRERRGDRTRARLLAAALAEFRAEGFGRASVAAIAERAGVSRPTFYFYFPTKDHVLLELQRSIEEPLARRIEQCAALSQAIDAFVEGLLESQAAVGDPRLYGEMLRIYVRRPPEVSLDEQASPVLQALGRQFARGARGGELRRGLDPARATHLCLTSVFGYLISARGAGDDRRADLRALTSLYLNDSPKGSRG
jgi:AcrR family transcriptional regulator